MEINITTPEKILSSITQQLGNRNLIPIVGSGLSAGVLTERGSVPSGEQYREHMLKTLCLCDALSEEDKKEIANYSFSQLCDLYEDEDFIDARTRSEYLRNNFWETYLEITDVRRKFFDIEWEYIYTLNIDDLIEKNSEYKLVVRPNRDINEDIFLEGKCVIKLHGDIGDIVVYKKSDKIFTSKEYAMSIEKNAALLNKLRNDYQNQNILFIGCSLSDEIDLKTLEEVPINYYAANEFRKRYFFYKGEPSKLLISKLKQFGVTDVVCFESYSDMYIFLEKAWKASKEIQHDQLDGYKSFQKVNVPFEDKELNQEYFFWGKCQISIKERKVYYPYFDIRRNLLLKIMRNFLLNKVHILYGKKYSGKSYLLCGLYKEITDREVYLFDGRNRLSDSSVDNILEKKEIIALFDAGTLSRSQFEKILCSSKKINENHSDFVIVLNSNDTDTYGLITWKLREGVIDPTDILSYTIKNKLEVSGDENELEKINVLMPKINLPVFEEKRTFLDQIEYASASLHRKNKFSYIRIAPENERELALLIIFAIQGKAYSSDIIRYRLEDEIGIALKKYSPFIERDEVDLAEKSRVDLSSIKYSLNSKYWLCRELGEFAKETDNVNLIVQSFKYIIQCILSETGRSKSKRRRLCRDFVQMDVLNEVFINKNKGNISLIATVYGGVKSLLSDDYHFLHQNAKCYLNYYYFAKKHEDRRKYINEAFELVIVSKSILEKEYSSSKNESVYISLSHVNYTCATILAEMCMLENYSDLERVRETISRIGEAISSPYNSDDYRQEKRQQTSRGIMNFAKKVLLCGIRLNREESKVLNEIVTR